VTEAKHEQEAGDEQGSAFIGLHVTSRKMEPLKLFEVCHFKFRIAFITWT
jgi:hypothetical protein